MEELGRVSRRMKTIEADSLSEVGIAGRDQIDPGLWLAAAEGMALVEGWEVCRRSTGCRRSLLDCR